MSHSILRKAALTAMVVPALVFGLQGTAFASEIKDPANDVVNADTGESVNAPAADIASASVEKFADRLELNYRIHGFVDPTTDGGWGSGDTFSAFDLDVNRDGKTDFAVEYGSDGGKLYADVYKINGDNADLACSGEAGYFNNAYTVKVPLSCLGNPREVKYRVATFYDTDPDTELSVVASDVAPNSGFADM